MLAWNLLLEASGRGLQLVDAAQTLRFWAYLEFREVLGLCSEVLFPTSPWMCGKCSLARLDSSDPLIP